MIRTLVVLALAAAAWAGCILIARAVDAEVGEVDRDDD